MADEKTPLDLPPAYDGTGGVAVPAAQPPQRPGGGPRAPLPLNLPALNMIRGKRVILASASPRRRQLLAQVGPSFRTNFIFFLQHFVHHVQYKAERISKKSPPP